MGVDSHRQRPQEHETSGSQPRIDTHQSDTTPTVNISDQSIHLRLVTSVEDAFAPPAPISAGVASLTRHLDRLEAVAHRWLVTHSIPLLRLSLGAVFLVFGVLKFAAR